MKLLICSLVIFANISNNIKASIDSIIPTNANILLEDNTRNSDQACHRPCKFNVKPRICIYNFKIEPTVQENGKAIIAINGISPGPPIHVCVNDIIVVEVHNKIPDEDIAIHWHGVEQKGTPYMDGVPMVTQCPIGYGSRYRYAFKASSPGTYFYHSDSVSHQSDGVFGVLTVSQPQPLDPNSNLYDYDRTMENTLLVSASFQKLLTGNLGDSTSLKPTSIKINGEANNFKMFVMSGFAYRLRLINAIGVECPIVIYIDEHELVVISTDGKPVKPVSARKVKLYPGERMDVVVRASQKSGGYWLRSIGKDSCKGLSTSAMFLYSGFNYTSMLDHEEKRTGDTEFDSDIVYGQFLESLQDVSFNTEPEKVYLGVDRNIVHFKEDDNDFRYTSDAMKRKPFFPSFLETQGNGVVQVNGKNFLYPNSPLLLMSAKLQNKCNVGEEDEKHDLQCVQVLNTDKGKVVEIALVNEGFGSNDSYTFHMHGYSMQVVSTWKNPENKPISRQQFHEMDRSGKVKRNLQNPVLKDTVIIPNKGFTIVRFKTDNGGSWILECRSCGLFSLPAAIIIDVPQYIPHSIISSLPKCGNYRPPDVLLN